MKITERFTRPRATIRRSGICLVGLTALAAAPAHGQRAIDLQVGRWMAPGTDPTYYSAALWNHIWGPFGYSLRGHALIDSDSLSRSLYGLGPEISLLRGLWLDRRLSVYAVGGTGLALRAGDSSGLSALWNAGVGVELRAPAWFAATLEARRLAEDRKFHGFWDLGEGDRAGWALAVGFSIRWGGPSSAARPRPRPTAPPSGAYPADPIPAGTESPSASARELTDRIVETALGAMGEPYRWGGTDTDEGFDCSGLVWYAYSSHGVRLPRTSRDQARAGRPVSANVPSLRAGDILLFSDDPGTITHVGLYVGDGRFIHATTSGGVRVGTLNSSDANDRWYVSRWVGARRILMDTSNQ